jgi:hypothetical protein
LAGYILGPAVLNLIPFVDILSSHIGTIGLLLLIFEHGVNSNFSWNIPDGRAFSLVPVGIVVAMFALCITICGTVLYSFGFPILEAILGASAVSTMFVGVSDAGWASIPLKDCIQGYQSDVCGRMVSAMVPSPDCFAPTVILFNLFTIEYDQGTCPPCGREGSTASCR